MPPIGDFLTYSRILDLQTPVTGDFTCAGTAGRNAHDHGRRCLRLIRIGDWGAIHTDVANLCRADTLAAVESHLGNLASHALCHQHQNQREEIVSRWHPLVATQRFLDGQQDGNVVARRPRANPRGPKEIKDDEMCGICTEVLTEPVLTPCGHLFCTACLKQWFNGVQRKTCPMDRKALAWGRLVMALEDGREEDDMSE
ncbi:uncharacterized protein LTR77_005196 [Saxophila tyrrhenica]|uniref:RING-type domain-containing protein n=1 Tax=Saxophila tyrrhenica TaxID=1690608 RepID=A0AAV9PBB9_9PEZI|nr:hypothetical protein LTR77_005196 [Saxophila tyrrhenica]